MDPTKHIGHRDESGTSRIQVDLREQLAQNDMLSRMASSAKQLKVGIVGAGFAGLRCADILLHHGAEVTIFEARDRVGGRVAQNHLGEHLIDLGPNWIHGSNDNPIMRLAEQTNTKLHSWEESSLIWDSQGTRLSADEAAEYAALQWDDGVIVDAFKYSNEHHDSIDPQRSLYDFYKQKAEGFFTDLPTQVAKRKRETFLQVASVWGAYVGSSFTKQSLKFFWLEEVIEGENPFVSGTYSRILEAVAKNARSKADLRLRSVVRSIKYGEEGSRLTLDDGSAHDFDEIVVTAPLGWLKHNKKAFQPPLHDRLAQAIDNIGYGTLDKVLIQFPSAFWQTNKAGDERSTGFFQWLAPIEDTSQFGLTGMNLAALSEGCAHPTVLIYTHGECSTHVAKLIKGCKNEEEKRAALIDFSRPYFSKLPQYDASNAECQPQAVLATAWANDEFAGYGSYTNFQVGLAAGDEDIKTMRHGVPEQGLWLAGEHTAPFIAMGTTTGAYWSGEKVAQRILEKHK